MKKLEKKEEFIVESNGIGETLKNNGMADIKKEVHDENKPYSINLRPEIPIEKKCLSKSALRDGFKKECENCRELIPVLVMPRHLKSCKVYSEFLKKSLHGYECTLCSNILRDRGNMHRHLKKTHGIIDDSEKKLEKKEEFRNRSTGNGEILKNNEMPVLEKKISEEVNEPVHEEKKPNSNNIKEVLNDVSLQYWRNIETKEMLVIKNEVVEESNELIRDKSEKKIEQKQEFVDASEKSLKEKEKVKEIGETLKSNEMVVINEKVSEEANDSVHVKNEHQSSNGDYSSEDKNDMKSNFSRYLRKGFKQR